MTDESWTMTWKRGGQARVVTATADLVVLVSTISSPPGSRIEADVPAAGDAGACVFKVKIHGSKKLASGHFRLEGRPLDLTREVRDRVVALATNESI